MSGLTSLDPSGPVATATVARRRFALSFRITAGLIVAWMAVAGCATAKVDWDSRIGTYSKDDAIRELGPPDKSATLTDGSTVADWLTGRGGRTATAYGGGMYPYGYGRWGGPHYVVVDPPSPDRFLRLTFDPQGKLASWRRVYQ